MTFIKVKAKLSRHPVCWKADEVLDREVRTLRLDVVASKGDVPLFFSLCIDFQCTVFVLCFRDLSFNKEPHNS